MVNNNKRPVEIFEVKGSYRLYQIAHVSKREYYLYRVYSPWYGFTNIIPSVGNTRAAQRISPNIAQKYAYKLTKEDGKSISKIVIGVSTIFAQLVFYQGLRANFIMSNLTVFFLSIGMTLVTWAIYTAIRYKMARQNNELIRVYQPDVKIRLYSSSWVGILCILVVVMFVLVASKAIQPFLIIFTVFFFGPAVYNIFPDVKSLQNTQNRIKLVKPLTLYELDCSNFKGKYVNKTVPLVKLSFLKYWSHNQNIGHARTDKVTTSVKQINQLKK